MDATPALAEQEAWLLAHQLSDLAQHPPPADVSRMVVVPFVSGQVVLIRLRSGRLCVPEWRVGMGRNYLHGAYLAPLAQAGVRLQRFHPFARSDADPHTIAGWIDGQLYETETDRIVLSAENARIRLVEKGNRQLADLVGRAHASFRSQSDESYYTDVRILLEESYLAAPTVYLGSGFGGDAARWRLARGLIADAIHKNGTFLDVGCANGLLMESMVAWAAEKGCRLEPHGLDISPRLAALARKRLPRWADRIYVGNVMTWQPPRTFVFVSTGLDYVPERRRKELVERLLADFIAPGGRLITTAYGLTADPQKAEWSMGEHLRAMGFTVGGEPERWDPEQGRLYRIAYIDKEEERVNGR